MQSPCCGMNCLKTIQTQHRSPFLCFPSHHGQAGHFYLVPSSGETLDSPGRAAATFQDVSTPLWHHLQIWVTFMAPLLLLGTHTSPWPGTSTPSGGFKDCETAKAGRQSSPLSHLLFGIIIHWEILTFLIGRNTIVLKTTYTEPFKKCLLHR